MMALTSSPPDPRATGFGGELTVRSQGNSTLKLPFLDGASTRCSKQARRPMSGRTPICRDDDDAHPRPCWRADPGRDLPRRRPGRSAAVRALQPHHLQAGRAEPWLNLQVDAYICDVVSGRFEAGRAEFFAMASNEAGSGYWAHPGKGSARSCPARAISTRAHFTATFNACAGSATRSARLRRLVGIDRRLPRSHAKRVSDGAWLPANASGPVRATRAASWAPNRRAVRSLASYLALRSRPDQDLRSRCTRGGLVDRQGHSTTPLAKSKPSSSQPAIPPAMIFTGRPRSARRRAPRAAPLQWGPAQ
jgi:hypothetical protein